MKRRALVLICAAGLLAGIVALAGRRGPRRRRARATGPATRTRPTSCGRTTTGSGPSSAPVSTMDLRRARRALRAEPLPERVRQPLVVPRLPRQRPLAGRDDLRPSRIRASSREGAINDAGQFQADLVALEAEVKDDRFADGWAFYDFGVAGSLRDVAEPLAGRARRQLHRVPHRAHRRRAHLRPVLPDAAGGGQTGRHPQAGLLSPARPRGAMHAGLRLFSGRGLTL